MKVVSTNFEKDTITYELSEGKHITLQKRAVKEFGLDAILRANGLDIYLPTQRIDVYQYGEKVGTVPPDFDPMFVKSSSFWYEPRSGDFTWEGDHLVAARMLGPGDLEAVVGFRWDR